MLTVQEFLWGYEDELACLNSDKNDDFFEDDDFFGEDEKEVEEKAFGGEKNFRRESDGKCIFGALRGRNDTYESAVTMLTGKYQIDWVRLRLVYLNLKHEIDGVRLIELS